MKLAYAVLPVVLAICGCGSEREAPTEQASASADAPTLDSRPIVGSLKPPVGKLATPGGRVKQLNTAS